jgi:hypothetical protein
MSGLTRGSLLTVCFDRSGGGSQCSRHEKFRFCSLEPDNFDTFVSSPQLEKKYEQARQLPARIENPRVLCAASEQYAEPHLGFHFDVKVLEKTFPQQVTVERKLTRKRLLELLTGQRFDIVHLVLAVDRDNGDLVFSPIDFQTYKPATSKPDKLSPQAFADLLVEAQTSLVVLATCEALLLAVEVSSVANMAASDAKITGPEAAAWEECFYGLLAHGKSLYRAFEITRSQISTPIRPIRYKDIAFGPTIARPSTGPAA